MIRFEQDNQKAYTLLLRIEIALRESLRISLESEFGAHWRKNLPGDLLKKIRDAQSEENKPQFNFVRLGPLYYLTFGELLNLLRQKAGRSVAEKLGGDCFLKQLESILVPRNALCHSRSVSSVGLLTIETLYAQMETALTLQGLTQLIANPDIGLRQEEAARDLIISLQQSLCGLPQLQAALEIPKAYESAVAQYWWADDSLAGFNRSRVVTAFDLILGYKSLPKGIGSAQFRQRFREQHNLDHQIEEAITELKRVKP